MQRKIFYFCLVLNSNVFIRTCQGQLRLSVEDAVNRALESRASLKAEAERIKVAEGARTQARLRSNPEFQFQNENLRPGQTYGRDVDTLAMINQQLDILGKRPARIAAADQAVELTLPITSRQNGELQFACDQLTGQRVVSKRSATLSR